MPNHKDWLAYAAGDLRVAKKISDDEYTLNAAAYHTQQAAEKALKAYLVFKKLPVPKTHKLVTLLELCIKSDNSFNQLYDGIEVLTAYATYTRYPDDFFSIDQEEVLDAIALALKIFKFVKITTNITEIIPQMSIFD
jgi:HEPN domain-containing protein